MPRLWLLMIVLFAPRAVAQDCTSAAMEDFLAAPVAALAGDLVPLFVGCRPSPGECVRSCPDR